MREVLIIGAGAAGCAVARFLKKYDVAVTVLEKNSDVAAGTSKANSGIVHAGFDAEPGSLKAKYNILGAAMFASLSAELDFPYGKCGAMVLCFDQANESVLDELKERGRKNGVEGLEIIGAEEIKARCPNCRGAVKALYAPTSGITDPYNFTIALAENACDNGAVFKFNEKVRSIARAGKRFKVTTDRASYEADCVVNAAGVYADEINNMVCFKKLSITARKGEYILLDKRAGFITDMTLFNVPTKFGKGVLISPTCHGNIIVGPTALDILDKEDTDTSLEGLKSVLESAENTVACLSRKDIITQFAGLRAHEQGGDFVVGESEDGFFNAAGIESPGLTAAPAIGRDLAESIAGKYGLQENKNFIAERKGIPHFASMSFQDRKKLIDSDSSYGHIVCRCETVSEGEIRNSVRRTLGARDLDGVKRRTRAGMGRCQSGFCAPLVMEIIAEELKTELNTVTKKGGGSYFSILETEANPHVFSDSGNGGKTEKDLK